MMPHNITTLEPHELVFDVRLSTKREEAIIDALRLSRWFGHPVRIILNGEMLEIDGGKLSLVVTEKPKRGKR